MSWEPEEDLEDRIERLEVTVARLAPILDELIARSRRMSIATERMNSQLDTLIARLARVIDQP